MNKLSFKFLKSLYFVVSKIVSFIYKDKSPKLPEIFFLIGTIFFPQMNVELIIRDENNNTVYIWRDDLFNNYGWHLPGGIIRPNETIINRVKKVIESETLLLNNVKEIIGPISISEVINEDPGFRSHFISLVFLVLIENKNLDNTNLSLSKASLSSSIPNPLIKNHRRYIYLLEKDNNFLSDRAIDNSK